MPPAQRSHLGPTWVAMLEVFPGGHVELAASLSISGSKGRRCNGRRWPAGRARRYKTGPHLRPPGTRALSSSRCRRPGQHAGSGLRSHRPRPVALCVQHRACCRGSVRKPGELASPSAACTSSWERLSKRARPMPPAGCSPLQGEGVSSGVGRVWFQPKGGRAAGTGENIPPHLAPHPEPPGSPSRRASKAMSQLFVEARPPVRTPTDHWLSVGENLGTGAGIPPVFNSLWISGFPVKELGAPSGSRHAMTSGRS